ncbi:MAG: hypothetical protein ACPG06_08870 [Alphaproteobacteria bacterium]
MAQSAGNKSDILDVEFRADGKVFLLVSKRRIPLPRRRALRMALGGLIAFVGLLPFLPISVVGIVILSVDVPWLAALRKRVVRMLAALRARFRRRRAAKANARALLALSNGETRQ